MTQLTWGAAGERHFETGVDRGVLYLPGRDGIAWSGLTSVDESPSGGSAKGYYIDGYKYANVAELEEFEATIEAFSAPYEFGECDGTAEIHRGLFVTEQPRKSFSFTYRTLIGNDLESTDFGYKIHIVYNALAEPSSRSYDSLSDNPSAETRSWKITTQPSRIPGRKPTAHLIIDSTRVNPVALGVLEAYIYGGNRIPPRLPSPARVIEFIGEYANREYDGPPIHISGQIGDELNVVNNYVTNPRGAALGLPLIIAENLQINPSFEDSTYGWSSSGTSELLTSNAYRTQMWGTQYGGPGVGSGARLLQAKGDGTTGRPDFYIITSSDAYYSVTPGTYLGASALVASDSALETYLVLQFLNASGATLSGPIMEPRTVSGFYAGRKATIFGVVPDTAVKARLVIWARRADGGNLVGTERMWVDDVLVVSHNTENAVKTLLDDGFFDGYTTNNEDFTPHWTGAVYRSVSQLRAPNPIGWDIGGSNANNYVQVYYSYKYDSLAWRWLGPAPSVINVKPGTDGGLASGRVRGIVEVLHNTGEEVTTYPLVSGQSLSTQKIPPGASSHSMVWDSSSTVTYLMRFTAGSGTPGQTIYFRQAIVSDEAMEQYFDGDTEYATYQNQRHIPYWYGTPHQSVSVFYHNTAFPATAREGDAVFVDGNWLFVMIDGYWTEIGRVPLP